MLEEAAHGIPYVTVLVHGIGACRIVAGLQRAKQAAGFGKPRFMWILWRFHKPHEIDDISQLAQQAVGKAAIIGKIVAVGGIKQVMVIAPNGVAFGKNIKRQFEGARSDSAASGGCLEKLFLGELPRFIGMRNKDDFQRIAILPRSEENKSEL